MIPNYIDDGYEAKGYLAESADFGHGEFRFWYRPLSPPERDSIGRRVSETIGGLPNPQYDPTNAWEVSYKMLLKQLTRWELKNAAGEIVPIRDQSLRRMNQNLIPRVRNIILGFLMSERDPLDGESAPEPRSDSETLEADAKN